VASITKGECFIKLRLHLLDSHARQEVDLTIQVDSDQPFPRLHDLIL
jgi:hypothetical protein